MRAGSQRGEPSVNMSPHLPLGRRGRGRGPLRRGPIAQPAVKHAHALVKAQTLRDLAVPRIVRIVQDLEVSKDLRVYLLALGLTSLAGLAALTRLAPPPFCGARGSRPQAEQGHEGDPGHPAVSGTVEGHGRRSTLAAVGQAVQAPDDVEIFEQVELLNHVELIDHVETARQEEG